MGMARIRWERPSGSNFTSTGFFSSFFGSSAFAPVSFAASPAFASAAGFSSSFAFSSSLSFASGEGTPFASTATYTCCTVRMSAFACENQSLTGPASVETRK